MRYFTALWLLAAVVECVPQTNPLSSLRSSPPELPLVASKQVQPQYRSTAKRSILSYGPIKLYGLDEQKPRSGVPALDRKGQSGVGYVSRGMCGNCTLLSGRLLLRYKDGSPALPSNGVYIHHFLSFDIAKPRKNPIEGGVLGGVPFAEFVNSGQDSGDSDTLFTSPDGKYNSGFHLTRPRLLIQYDIVNYNPTAKDIYIDVEIEYVDGIQGKDAGQILKGVNGTPNLSTSGPAVTNSTKYRVTADSTIIWARGHLHAGGEKMILIINDKEVCISVPKYNDANVIISMSLCPEAIPLKKEDTMSVRAVYDLSTHKLRKSTDGSDHGAFSSMGGRDVMGMWMISYVLDA